MPKQQVPHDSDVDQISERLTDSLKSCRSVLANYKALLAEEKAPEAPDPVEPTETEPPR